MIIKNLIRNLWLQSGKLTSAKQILQIMISKFKFKKNESILKSIEIQNTFIKADINRLYKKFGWKNKNNIYEGLNIQLMIITRTPFRISLAGGGTDFKNFFQRKMVKLYLLQ